MRERRAMRVILPPNPPNPPTPSLPKESELAANLIIDVINRTNYLLDRQITALEDKFTKEGGYTEKLFRRRLDYRNIGYH